jgi:hypothetical protein
MSEMGHIIALVFGYGLLGAGWLVLKTEDDIEARAPLWPRWPGGCGDRDRGGESMDAAGEQCSLQPLVLLAKHSHFVVGLDALCVKLCDLGRRHGFEKCPIDGGYSKSGRVLLNPDLERRRAFPLGRTMSVIGGNST